MSDFDVEFEIKLLQRSVAKLEADARENYGAIKTLSGRVDEVRDKQEIQSQLRELRSHDLAHSGQIASVAEALNNLKQVLAESDDSGLAEAAAGITINLDAATKIQGDVEGDVSGGSMTK